jgi:hypothetical protein
MHEDRCLDTVGDRARAEALTARLDAAVAPGAGVTPRLRRRLPFNCEHAVPQSWFAEREPMRGDLHHPLAPGVSTAGGEREGNVTVRTRLETRAPVRHNAGLGAAQSLH